MSGSLQPIFFSESSSLMNPSFFANVLELGLLDIREEMLFLPLRAESDQERGIEFLQALREKMYTQGYNKAPLEAFLGRILLLSDTDRNRPVFSKITVAFFKREGCFGRLFSKESWEEWTERRTALGRVVSQFRDCAQSRTQIENCLRKLDERVVQKANEEAEALLKEMDHTDEAMSEFIESGGSCVRGMIGGTFVSLVTKNPFPLFLGLSGCLPRGSAQKKIGAEFKINTYTFNDQGSPSVATFNNGNFVVTWDSLVQDTNNSRGVYGQLFNENGTKIGIEFQVNNHTANHQDTPSVKSFPNGNFVVVWESLQQDGSFNGVYGQLFNGMGTKIGNEFLINTYTTNSQREPSVASFTNDNFVVIWPSYFQNSNFPIGVYGQMFTDNATKIGSEFQVNNYTINDQANPSVASFPDGNFVVTWDSLAQGTNNSREVYGQLFNENGTKIGIEFQVNNHTASYQDTPSVKSFPNGNFVVVWESLQQDGSFNGVYGQLFNGMGTKIGNEFLINTYTTNSQLAPSVASFTNDNFVVIWPSYFQDSNNSIGVYGQMFTDNATKIGNEFQVNTYTSNDQRYPSVAILKNGNFVVTWESEGQDGSGRGVYGQIFRDNITQSASATTLPSSTRTITSWTTPSSFPSSITSISTSSPVKTTSLYPSNSKTNPIVASSKGNKKISWLWALLGAAGGAIYLGLAGYFLLRKRSRQQEEDLSGDPEKAEIPLRDVRSGGSSASAPSATDHKRKTTSKVPPILSGNIGGTETHTRTRRDSRLSPDREEKKHTRIEKKYDLVNKISREEAADLFAQTGIEIVFPEGKRRADVVLGAGNFGKLRIARHAETKEFVGVKKVKGAEKIAKSRDEGALQKKLEGKSHIMPVLDFVESTSSEDEPVLYQFMPLAGFGNGDELIRRLHGLDPESKDRVLTHVAQGLLTGFSHMHAAHIFHCDMKPSNMVLGRKGEVFIIDFGCAKELSGGTVREEISGNTRYFSPERLEFSRQIENDYQPESFSAEKADAWALGVTLLELAIGTYPFDSTRYSERLANWDREYFQRKLDAISDLRDPPPGSSLAIVKGLLIVGPKERLSIDEALAQLSSTKPFSNETEQEQIFADLKQGASYSSENVSPQTPRDKDENYANFYRWKHGFGSTGSYGFPHGKSEPADPAPGSSSGEDQNEFGT